MSTIFSTLVLDVKMKSSSTHSTYFVVTCDTARFLPANQPYTERKAVIKKDKKAKKQTNLYCFTTAPGASERHKWPCLSERHDVVFNVRPAHWLRMLIIVRYHNGDGGVVLPYAVNEVFQFVVAQEGLGGDGDESANIVLCVNTKRDES